MNLHEALMTGRNMSAEEATDTIQEMKKRFWEGEDPEEILHEYGFEPDYIFDIIGC